MTLDGRTASEPFCRPRCLKRGLTLLSFLKPLAYRFQDNVEDPSDEADPRVSFYSGDLSPRCLLAIPRYPATKLVNIEDALYDDETRQKPPPLLKKTKGGVAYTIDMGVPAKKKEEPAKDKKEKRGGKYLSLCGAEGDPPCNDPLVCDDPCGKRGDTYWMDDVRGKVVSHLRSLGCGWPSICDGRRCLKKDFTLYSYMMRKDLVPESRPDDAFKPWEFRCEASDKIKSELDLLPPDVVYTQVKKNEPLPFQRVVQQQPGVPQHVVHEGPGGPPAKKPQAEPHKPKGSQPAYFTRENPPPPEGLPPYFQGQ